MFLFDSKDSDPWRWPWGLPLNSGDDDSKDAADDGRCLRIRRQKGLLSHFAVFRIQEAAQKDWKSLLFLLHYTSSSVAIYFTIWHKKPATKSNAVYHFYVAPFSDIFNYLWKTLEFSYSQGSNWTMYKFHSISFYLKISRLPGLFGTKLLVFWFQVKFMQYAPQSVFITGRDKPKCSKSFQAAVIIILN